MIDDVTKACMELLPNHHLKPFIDKVSQHTRVETLVEEIEGIKQEYTHLPDVGVLVEENDAGLIEAIIYESPFLGTINGIKMGMTGDEVEALLGPPDRLWPMPHPNYIIMYDEPTFFRVELDRKSEQVILMIR